MCNQKASRVSEKEEKNFNEKSLKKECALAATNHCKTASLLHLSRTRILHGEQMSRECFAEQSNTGSVNALTSPLCVHHIVHPLRANHSKLHCCRMSNPSILKAKGNPRASVQQLDRHPYILTSSYLTPSLSPNGKREQCLPQKASQIRGSKRGSHHSTAASPESCGCSIRSASSFQCNITHRNITIREER